MAHHDPMVLFVEDEPDIAQVVQVALKRAGFRVEWVDNGEDARRKLSVGGIDLLLLDLILPDIDGFTLAREVRSNESLTGLPVIMLTSRTEEEDVVRGLEEGADDYITKPFSPKELVARVRAALRRVREADGPVDEKRAVQFGTLQIDPVRHVVEVEDHAVPVTLAEFRLIHFLMKNEGRAFTRKELLPHVVGEGVQVIDRNIDVHVRNVRKKLGPCSSHIVTVRGVGYRFDANPAFATLS